MGVDVSERDQVEGRLLAELDGPEEVGCVWSDSGDSHLVVLGYTGVVRRDLTIDPEDPRFEGFAIGYGTSWEEAEEFATRLDARYVRTNDGSGYEVLVRETWGVANAAAGMGSEPGRGPGARTPVSEPAAALEPGTVFRDCTGCPEMVVVPAGSFMMGSPSTEADRKDAEGPRHRVTIGSAFAAGVYEVTFAEWDACVRAGGCGGHNPDDEGWGRGRRPVMNVSWEDARAYVEWLSRETGERYRLLSEAEWEYVARAGTATSWYWGESESAQCRYANGADDYVACSDGYRYTAPVGSFEPNAFGLYDVSGNVVEWTEDCWNGSYAGAPSDGSAWRSGDCTRPVLRGGSWGNAPVTLRSAVRVGDPAGFRILLDGFRVARTIN